MRTRIKVTNVDTGLPGDLGFATGSGGVGGVGVVGAIGALGEVGIGAGVMATLLAAVLR